MEKLNIAELLKDCPKGMELDCTMYDKVYLLSVDNNKDILFPITVVREDGNYIALTKYGQYADADFAKCVIFPKGETTWEGFHKPFKDGDIVAIDSGEQVFIFKDKKENNILSSCYLMLDDDELVLEEGMYYVTRLATEEEKRKLFQAIKDNGYKWNAETKTLDKLVTIFKVGDRIKLKNAYAKKYGVFNIRKITEIKHNHYILDGKETMFLSNQYLYELAPNKFDITTLKPFESRVLVRNVGAWEPAFWGYYSKEYAHPFVVDGGNTFAQCIPYEKNEHLLGTTNDCDEYYKTWE